MANATVAFLMLFFALACCYAVCSGNGEAENAMIDKGGLDGVDHLEEEEDEASPTEMTVTDRGLLSGPCSPCIKQAKRFLKSMRVKQEFVPSDDFCLLFNGTFNARCKEDNANLMKTYVGNVLLNSIMPDGGGTKNADICGMTMPKKCQKKSKRMGKWTDWKVTEEKLSKVKNPDQKWPKGTMTTEKILHLSAIQLQMDYQVGSQVQCGLPQCCYGSEIKDGASEIGEYGCGLRPETFATMLEDIKKKDDDIKYIYLTVDFPVHDIWKKNARTIKTELDGAKKALELVKTAFPTAQIFPTIGSFDFPPVDNDFKKKLDQKEKEIYDEVVKMYEALLPTETYEKLGLKKETYYGFHTFDVPGKDLTLISINTNFCNPKNFWNLRDFTDPHGQVKWFFNQLTAAQARNKVVHVVGGAGLGTKKCFGKYSQEYNKLAKRFSNVIAGQFFGNTHKDEFQLVFGRTATSKRKEVPVGVMYLTPSLTPVKKGNPTYRIYKTDVTTKLVVDHDTYTMDLEKAKTDNEITFQKSYSAMEGMKVKSLSPTDLFLYVIRMQHEVDGVLFNAYLDRYDHSPKLDEACLKDPVCKTGKLCDLLASDSSLRAKDSKNKKCIKKLGKKKTAKKDKKRGRGRAVGKSLIGSLRRSKN